MRAAAAAVVLLGAAAAGQSKPAGGAPGSKQHQHMTGRKSGSTAQGEVVLRVATLQQSSARWRLSGVPGSRVVCTIAVSDIAYMCKLPHVYAYVCNHACADAFFDFHEPVCLCVFKDLL